MVKTELRIIYGDTDMMGVIYHGNYFRYFESGRNEFLRAMGFVYRDMEREYGVFLPVVDAQAIYKSPGRYDDVLRIETELVKVGAASVRFDYRVVRGADLLVTGHTTHACIDREGKVTKLPESIREALLRVVADPAPGK